MSQDMRPIDSDLLKRLNVLAMAAEAAANRMQLTRDYAKKLLECDDTGDPRAIWEQEDERALASLKAAISKAKGDHPALFEEAV